MSKTGLIISRIYVDEDDRGDFINIVMTSGDKIIYRDVGRGGHRYFDYVTELLDIAPGELFLGAQVIDGYMKDGAEVDFLILKTTGGAIPISCVNHNTEYEGIEIKSRRIKHRETAKYH